MVVLYLFVGMRWNSAGSGGSDESAESYGDYGGWVGGVVRENDNNSELKNKSTPKKSLKLYLLEKSLATISTQKFWVTLAWGNHK